MSRRESTSEAAEAMRLAEARILNFIANQLPGVGVPMARCYGPARFQPRTSKPARKLPGPSSNRQSMTVWRDQLIYRLWRQDSRDLGSTAFAEDFVKTNSIYLGSTYKFDERRGEPPADQEKAACYLIAQRRLAVPSSGRLRNILDALHKDYGNQKTG